MRKFTHPAFTKTFALSQNGAGSFFIGFTNSKFVSMPHDFRLFFHQFNISADLKEEEEVVTLFNETAQAENETMWSNFAQSPKQATRTKKQ